MLLCSTASLHVARFARLVLGAVLVLGACDDARVVAPPTQPTIAPLEGGPNAASVGTPTDPPPTAAPPALTPRKPPVTEPVPTPVLGPTTLVTRPTPRDGATVSAWIVRPPVPPTHAVVLMVGGSGKLGLSEKGVGVGARDNVLVRTHARLVEAGFVVAIVDAPSDRTDGLEGTRASADHAADLAVIIALLREQHAVPVWIVGTSRGSISAANAAARLGARGPDGIVLLSPITAGSHERLSDVRLAAITVPTLVVSHRADRCKGSPPGGAHTLTRKLGRKAIRRELRFGARKAPPEADPCDSRTHHGFVGVEDELTDAIVAFVRTPSG